MSVLTPDPGLVDPSTGSRRRRVGLLVVIALLVLSNVMANRVIPGWAYIPWNFGMAVALLFVAHRAGTGPVAAGLGIRHWHRPVGVGLLLAAGTALIFGIGMAIPSTRDAFIDSRARDASIGLMLYQVLLRIPLGTVVIEEVAFRGVLPALMGASPAIRWKWGPVMGASFLFGLWHILPSIGIATGNAAVSDVLGGNQFVATVLAVVSMTVAGVLMCGLARLGKGIKTTMLLHWATNSLGFVAAWLLMH
ncbi:CPBP family intramembrane glutamic endopeptidase [Nakamurella sp. A5-74]|uniref:CPBP family intramembrane glutamic endopeptidase n=1 Tax=Nakamurella sp. A5-74 TaxID=3158264 RepID=A0AAU8DP22_9ACTN